MQDICMWLLHYKNSRHNVTNKLVNNSKTPQTFVSFWKLSCFELNSEIARLEDKGRRQKKGHQGLSIDCVFKCSIYDNLNAYHIFMCKVMALHIRLINKLWYRHKYLWRFLLVYCPLARTTNKRNLWSALIFILVWRSSFHYIQRNVFMILCSEVP